MARAIAERGPRPLLTFRLDPALWHDVRTRLAHDGRTLSEVVNQGLERYVDHSDAPACMPGGAAPQATCDHAADEAGTAEPDRTREPGGAAERSGGAERRSGAGWRGGAERRDGAGWRGGAERRDGAERSGGAARSGAAERRGAAERSGELALPPEIASVLRELRAEGNGKLLSATLAHLHEIGWPLRTLADALGISRQAVQARVRQAVPEEVRLTVERLGPPPLYPRQRQPMAPGIRRSPSTVQVDDELRHRARVKAWREGASLTQVVERILRTYLHHHESSTDDAVAAAGRASRGKAPRGKGARGRGGGAASGAKTTRRGRRRVAANDDPAQTEEQQTGLPAAGP